MNHALSRRKFLASSSLLLLAAVTRGAEPPAETPEPIIDIHQHTNYSFRTDEQLLAHQSAMGVTQTILLPAGCFMDWQPIAPGTRPFMILRSTIPANMFISPTKSPACRARARIEKWLKKGAIGIAEQKFHVDCDSPAIEEVAAVAQEFNVPVLLHFQHEVYNFHFERFHKILENSRRSTSSATPKPGGATSTKIPTKTPCIPWAR